MSDEGLSKDERRELYEKERRERLRYERRIKIIEFERAQFFKETNYLFRPFGRSGKYKLINTPFLFDGVNWFEKKNGMWAPVSFDYVMDNIPEHLQEEILFNMDILANF